MERKDFTTIGDVLRECLEQSSMQTRLEEVRACEAFAGVVGEGFSSQCGRPEMRRGVMRIKVENAALRNELNMHRTAIANAINELRGKDIVGEVVFV